MPTPSKRAATVQNQINLADIADPFKIFHGKNDGYPHPFNLFTERQKCEERNLYIRFNDRLIHFRQCLFGLKCTIEGCPN